MGPRATEEQRDGAGQLLRGAVQRSQRDLRRLAGRARHGHELARLMATFATDRGGIVCLEAHAAEAGQRILERGGNAIDAVIAASFVQGVVNPMMCGLGGTARLLLYL